MRLFRRARDAKTSVIGREAAAAPAAARISLIPPSRPSSPVAPVIEPVEGAIPPAPPSYDKIEDSDVFLCAPESTRPATAVREVTLFVHGWHNVEPGLLSWTFPSLRAALDAVQRMKNAIGWCVVSGTGWSDLETARANGAILVEQLS
jgi:hypothetical protein